MNEDYIKRIDKILTYIDENLDSQLALEHIAKIAYYSPFHFHRLFKAITNETLNSYITRKRIEKIAGLLIHRKELSISEVAIRYGFSSSSSFTRAFNKYYGQSPTLFRKINSNKFSKIGKENSKNGQEKQIIEEYICHITNLKNWITMNAKIEIKEMPTLELAFVTCIGVNGVENAFDKLLKWAKPKGLLDQNDFKMARIYHDSFKITEPDKVRMSVCIILDQKAEVSGEVGLTTIEKGKFITGHFLIEPKDFEKAWTGLYIWMNENGYIKAERNPFEMIYNNFNDHPEKKCSVDLFIPIE